MNLSLANRDPIREGEGKMLTKSVRDITKQLADDRIFKGRGSDVEHLACKGWEIPSTNRSGLSHVCEDWDKALKPNMNPEPREFVSMGLFEWVASGVAFYMITLGIAVAKLAALLRGHRVKVDGIETRLAREHQENQTTLVQMKTDLLKGQERLGGTMDALRRTVDDVMLQRGRGADVDRQSRRRNGEE